MALVPALTVEHLAEARDRVTEAFKDKTVFDKYLQLLIEEQEELGQVFNDLLQKRSIDEATGATLDIIGNIVGQERLSLPFNPDGTPSSVNFIIDDATYRLFIKSKIFKNTTSSSPEEFIRMMNFIFNSEQTLVEELGNASFEVWVGRLLNPYERALLDYVSIQGGYPSRFIPKPVGVRINYEGEFASNNYFGFLDTTPGAKGFGDLQPGGEVVGGGIFANLYI